MKKHTVINQINVTPFVDVMLVLLIVFMVTSPMLENEVKVNLPDIAEAQSSNNPNKPIVFSINSEGNIFLHEKEINSSEISKALSNITQDNQSIIFVRGDKDTSYGQIAKVISSIKLAGFDKISLISNIQ